MSGVHFKGVNKRYGDAQHGAHIVRDLDLVVRPGEFMVLVGPSGCGKSTTLRMLAGLEEVSAGQIFIGDREVTQVPPAQRDVAMVFQSYALYPHMSVAENMGFSLRMAGRSKGEIEAAVAKAARILQLEPLLTRKPRELSGGQRQRVAIGRAIVREPKVFLFDEPLSNLDAALRTQTRLELARLHEQLGATVIYVTHDQVEAMTLGQRIAIFNQGRIEQVGSPLEVYQRPATRFVAGFMGSPRINFLPVRLCGALTLPPVVKPEQIAELAVRPEHLRLLPLESGQGLQGTLDVIEHLGDTSLAYVRLSDLSESVAVKLSAAQGQALQRGQTLRLSCEPQHLIPFDAAGLSLLQ